MNTLMNDNVQFAKDELGSSYVVGMLTTLFSDALCTENSQKLVLTPEVDDEIRL